MYGIGPDSVILLKAKSNIRQSVHATQKQCTRSRSEIAPGIWVFLDGQSWGRTVFQNSNCRGVGTHRSLRPGSATRNCTGPVRRSSTRSVWSRFLTRSPVNVPPSSHNSVRGIFTTMRWSGLKVPCFSSCINFLSDRVEAYSELEFTRFGSSAGRRFKCRSSTHRLHRISGMDNRNPGQASGDSRLAASGQDLR